MKKVIALLVLVGLLSFSLGCGGSGTTAAKKTEAGGKSTETTEAKKEK